MPLFLIIDDEPSIRNLLKETLSSSGRVLEAVDGEDGLKQALIFNPDVTFLDVRMPKKDGLTVLRELRKHNFTAPVIVITAFGDFDTATTAMQEGAFDYVVKPFNLEMVEEVAKRALQTKIFIRAGAVTTTDKDTFKESFIGKSPAIQEVFKIIGQVAALDVPVLITGESGSGKELVARSIHRLSLRNKGPFVPVNCAAIPETLLESELFGYEKGAFTGASQSKIGRFEESVGGTIFLDEIGDMSLPLQAKLLRVLQDKRVRRLGGNEEINIDTRFIFATNKDISKMVKAGKFREDLYFRVDVVNIAIPPLRERKDDIPLLVDYFLKKYSQEYGRNSVHIGKEDLEKITDYHFPGNVRELENIIARGVSLSRGSLVVLELPAFSEVPAVEEALKGGDILPLEEAVKEREKEVIGIALRKSSGNKEIAAKILKIPVRTLYRKIKEHDL